MSYQILSESQPPPKLCAICGNNDDLVLRTYKKSYLPPYSILLILAGFIFGAIMIVFIKRTYTFSTYCCAKCRPSSGFIKTFVHIISMISSISLLITGPIVGLIYSSWFIGLGSITLAILISVFAGEYDNAKSPKIIKYGKDNLTLDIPNYGHWVISFAKK